MLATQTSFETPAKLHIQSVLSHKEVEESHASPAPQHQSVSAHSYSEYKRKLRSNVIWPSRFNVLIGSSHFSKLKVNLFGECISITLSKKTVEPPLRPALKTLQQLRQFDIHAFPDGS